MKNYWKLVKIGDIGEVVGGGTPSTKCSDYYGGDIPWITPKDLSNFRNRYISRGERMISKLGLENSSARMLPPFSVLFTSRAPIGYIAIAKNELCTNQGFKSIIPDPKKCNALFLYYLLKYKKNDIELIANGSTFQEVSGTALKNFEVSIPPLDEQRKIAGILSALDDKIELNNKINRNLEAQAQAIFKSWFIDFEPFKNGKFIDSELGKIPEGWDIGTIGDISIISTGKRPDKKSVNKSNETPIPIIGASSIMGYTNKALYNDKILITGRVGTHGIIQKIDSPCWPSDNTLVLRSKNLNFLHNCLLLINWKSMNRGSTQPLITQNDLKNTRIILPQDKIIQNYEQLVHYFDIKFHNNNKEIYALSQICDLLLPKLMSGEVNISDYIA